MKITSSQEFAELLDKFREKLYEKIPYAQNCLISFQQNSPASVLCRIETESSGVDHYQISLNPSGEAEFIRVLFEGDSL